MKQPKPTGLMRGLRRKQSDAEAKLWFYLQNRQLKGIKFRRQYSLDNFIVDFVSLEKKLVIEVDGGQHNELPGIQNDEKRTKYLEGSGFQVIRFWNNDVLENIDGVLEKIIESL